MGLRTRRLGTRYKQEESVMDVENADNSNHITIMDVTSMMMLIGIGDWWERIMIVITLMSSPPHWILASLWIYQRQLQVSLLWHPGEARLTTQPAAGRHAVHGHEATACPPETEVSTPSPLFPFLPRHFVMLAVPSCPSSPFIKCHFSQKFVLLFPSNKDLMVKMKFCLWYNLPHRTSFLLLPTLCRLLYFTFCLLPLATRVRFRFAARNTFLFFGCGNTGSLSGILLLFFMFFFLCFSLNHGSKGFSNLKIWKHWKSLLTLVAALLEQCTLECIGTSCKPFRWDGGWGWQGSQAVLDAFVLTVGTPSKLKHWWGKYISKPNNFGYTI